MTGAMSRHAGDHDASAGPPAPGGNLVRAGSAEVLEEAGREAATTRSAPAIGDPAALHRHGHHPVLPAIGAHATVTRALIEVATAQVARAACRGGPTIDRAEARVCAYGHRRLPRGQPRHHCAQIAGVQDDLIQMSRWSVL